MNELIIKRSDGYYLQEMRPMPPFMYAPTFNFVIRENASRFFHPDDVTEVLRLLRENQPLHFNHYSFKTVVLDKNGAEMVSTC